MIEGVFAGLAAGLTFVTFLPVSTGGAWWIRAWDFPRVQLAWSGFAIGAATAWWGDFTQPLTWLVLGASVACALYHVCWIFPYTPLAPREVRSAAPTERDRRLRIISSNVLISNRDATRLLRLVRELTPDILVTLESDAWWESQLDALADQYPHRVQQALDNAYGMHVYSRLPLEDARVEFLVEPDIPSIHATAVLPCGARVRVHFLHPAPPSPTENDESTQRDAELVIVARRVAREREPAIVTGDLNDVAWSKTTRLFRKLSRLLDPRIGRGMFNSYHARWFFVRWPLDHFFHSEHFTLVKLRRLPRIGSDHFPMQVELALEPARAAEQEAPQPDHEDHQLAREKLEEARRREPTGGRHEDPDR